MAGIPTESPLVLRESLGSFHYRLTSAEDYARGFTFGLSARRSFGREGCIPCRTERQSLTLAYPRLTPGLNAGACAHHGVRDQALRQPWTSAGRSRQPFLFELLIRARKNGCCWRR